MNTNQQIEFKSLSVRRHDYERAFTLTELLVVLATLGILAAVLLPALASNQPGASKAFQCLNNMRQLGLAELLYANDNHDKLPTNSDRNNRPPAFQNWICPGGATLDWSTGSLNTNTLYLTINQILEGQQFTALMGSYVSKSVTIFVCPADTYLSKVQQAAFAPAGWTHRIRSCAMNGAIGDGSKWYGFNASGTPNTGHTGQWLSFYNAKKVTDMHSPKPSDCFMILDQNPDSDDDACFYVCPQDANGSGTSMTEVPGALHGNAAGMVYADGHSAMHVWNGNVCLRLVMANPTTGYYDGINISATADVNDETWLAQHTPAN